MKVTKKLISVLLIAVMIVSCIVVANAADKKLAKYYTTNAGGKVGVKKTITIDGDGSDWSDDMKIAQSGAWDVANHWKGAHENCLIDAAGLYAAWDSSNLYIGMQYVNTTDTWQNAGDASLMDGGKMGDLHLVLALSVDPSSTGLTGKVTNGDYIWGDKINYNTHVDHLFYMSTKAGSGVPGHFTVSDASGNSDYTAHCGNFKNEGIEYKMYDGNVGSTIWGLNDSQKTDDVFSDDSNWVDYKTFKGSKGVHNTKYDSFYEIKIPFAAIGITESQLTSKGIGAMTLCGRGESALDSCPFDVSMLDNVKGDYACFTRPEMKVERVSYDVITPSAARAIFSARISAIWQHIPRSIWATSSAIPTRPRSLRPLRSSVTPTRPPTWTPSRPPPTRSRRPSTPCLRRSISSSRSRARPIPARASTRTRAAATAWWTQTLRK